MLHNSFCVFISIAVDEQVSQFVVAGKSFLQYEVGVNSFVAVSVVVQYPPELVTLLKERNLAPSTSKRLAAKSL